MCSRWKELLPFKGQIPFKKRRKQFDRVVSLENMSVPLKKQTVHALTRLSSDLRKASFASRVFFYAHAEYFLSLFLFLAMDPSLKQVGKQRKTPPTIQTGTNTNFNSGTKFRKSANASQRSVYVLTL